MYSYGPPHMAVQKQDDQHEHTFSSYVRIRDVVLKTYLGRWTIGRSGERGSGISVLPARYDDDFQNQLLRIKSVLNHFKIAVINGSTFQYESSRSNVLVTCKNIKEYKIARAWSTMPSLTKIQYASLVIYTVDRPLILNLFRYWYMWKIMTSTLL